MQEISSGTMEDISSASCKSASGTTETRSINYDNKKKIPYPKSVFVVILNEYCERFSYLGLRAILSIYLVEQLLFSESEATVIFHGFHFVAFCFPLIGSIIADGWLGKFKTIFYFCLVYACGSTLVTLASIGPLNLPTRTLTVLGLFVIAIGTGAIKTSVMPFGAEQFVLPQQQKQLIGFYSMFYFLITFGGLLSTTITPLLRKHVSCFGKDSCYPLAFGLPAIFMLMSVVIFYLARRWYRILPHEDNIIVKICKCTCYALKMRIQSKGLQKNHWLDYSEEKYGEKLVEDIKLVLRVFFMFLPIPLYWALIEQTATAWVFMARRMNGDLGFYTLSPDQTTLIGSIIYVSLIPLLQFVLIPRLGRYGIIKTSLQKMTTGGFFVVASFLVAAGVSFAVESSNCPVIRQGEGQLTVYNTLPCDVSVFAQDLNFSIAQGSYYKKSDLKIDKNQWIPFELNSSCANISGNFDLLEEKAVGYYFKNKQEIFFSDDVEKEDLGLPLVRTLVNSNGYQISPTSILYIDEKGKIEVQNDTNLNTLAVGTYIIKMGDSEYKQQFSLGGLYAVYAIATNKSYFDITVVEIIPPHSVHILWIFPPGFLLDIGIILFSVPGLEFAYSQAPACMRSVIMAGWLLTTAIGNLIIVIIQAIDLFEKSYYNFLLYSALMLVDAVIFVVMAAKYKYVKSEEITSTTFANAD